MRQLSPLSDYHRRILRILPRVRQLREFSASAYLAFPHNRQLSADEQHESDCYHMEMLRYGDLEQRLINRLNGIPKPR